MTGVKNKNIFRVALLLSAAFHAVAYLSIGLCTDWFHISTAFSAKTSKADIIQVGLLYSSPAPQRASIQRQEIKKINRVAASLGPSDIKIISRPHQASLQPDPAEVKGLASRRGRGGEARRSLSLQASDYLDRVRRKIEAAVYYPRRARLRHVEGVVKVGFNIGPAGGLLNPRLIKASSFSILNRAALTILARAAPFPEAEPDLLGQEIAVSIEFESTY